MASWGGENFFFPTSFSHPLIAEPSFIWRAVSRRHQGVEFLVRLEKKKYHSMHVERISFLGYIFGM